MTSPKTGLLFQQFMDGTATEEEKAELMDTLGEAKAGGTLDEVMLQLWKQYESTTPAFTHRRKEEMLQAILKKEGAVVRPMFGARRIAVAAAIIIITLGGYYLFNKNRAVDNTATTAKTPTDIPAPTETRAVITLADGNKLYLDSAGNGVL